MAAIPDNPRAWLEHVRLGVRKGTYYGMRIIGCRLTDHTLDFDREFNREFKYQVQYPTEQQNEDASNETG